LGLCIKHHLSVLKSWEKPTVTAEDAECGSDLSIAMENSVMGNISERLFSSFLNARLAD
jgi:hypothetical protein